MKPFLLILISIFVLSCSQSLKLEYKHSDKEQSIACSNTSDALLNEALYSFEEDIVKHYKLPNAKLIPTYAKFIFKGMTGDAPYQKIANSHSLAIRDALIAEGILITNGVKSNLNYTHPTVQCIINNIEDPVLKNNLNVLIETNTMDPHLFNSRPRKFGRKAEKHRYQATYIALDGYYQNLVGLSLNTETSNE